MLRIVKARLWFHGVGGWVAGGIPRAGMRSRPVGPVRIALADLSRDVGGGTDRGTSQGAARILSSMRGRSRQVWREGSNGSRLRQASTEKADPLAWVGPLSSAGGRHSSKTGGVWRHVPPGAPRSRVRRRMARPIVVFEDRGQLAWSGESYQEGVW